MSELPCPVWGMEGAIVFPLRSSRVFILRKTLALESDGSWYGTQPCPFLTIWVFDALPSFNLFPHLKMKPSCKN